jgi:hypothetical protein
MMNLQSRSRWPAAAFLVIEALAGLLFGLALGVLTGLAGARMFASSASGWGDLIGGLLGAIAGHTLGVSIGVYLAGRWLRGRGSYWLCLAGSVAGSALVLLAAEPLRLNATPLLLQAALILVPPITAALAFGRSRRQTPSRLE